MTEEEDAEFEKIELHLNQTMLVFDNYKNCFYVRARDKFGEYSTTKIYFYEDFSHKAQSLELEDFIKKRDESSDICFVSHADAEEDAYYDALESAEEDDEEYDEDSDDFGDLFDDADEESDEYAFDESDEDYADEE